MLQPTCLSPLPRVAPSNLAGSGVLNHRHRRHPRLRYASFVCNGDYKSAKICFFASPLAQVATASPHKTEKGAKKSTATRREELLKQLKAVEEAIAKKRSKLPS